MLHYVTRVDDGTRTACGSDRLGRGSRSPQPRASHRRVARHRERRESEFAAKSASGSDRRGQVDGPHHRPAGTAPRCACPGPGPDAGGSGAGDARSGRAGRAAPPSERPTEEELLELLSEKARQATWPRSGRCWPAPRRPTRGSGRAGGVRGDRLGAQAVSDLIGQAFAALGQAPRRASSNSWLPRWRTSTMRSGSPRTTGRRSLRSRRSRRARQQRLRGAGSGHDDHDGQQPAAVGEHSRERRISVRERLPLTAIAV